MEAQAGIEPPYTELLSLFSQFRTAVYNNTPYINQLLSGLLDLADISRLMGIAVAKLWQIATYRLCRCVLDRVLDAARASS